MKRNSVILLLLISAFTVQAQTASPDEFIRKVFASLQAKDVNAFLSLCPDSAQLVRIMKRIEQNVIAKIEADRKDWQKRSKNYSSHLNILSDETDSLVRTALQKNYSPENIQERREMFANGFLFMVEKGEKRGINWHNTTLIDYTYDVAGADQHQSFIQQSGYKCIHGVMHFKDGDLAYQMSFTEMMFLREESGWYGGMLLKLVRENEPLANDHEGEEVREVVIQNIAIDIPPPSPSKLKNKKTTIKKKRQPKP